MYRLLLLKAECQLFVLIFMWVHQSTRLNNRSWINGRLDSKMMRIAPFYLKPQLRKNLIKINK